MNKKWIDFIQNMDKEKYKNIIDKDGKVTSLINGKYDYYQWEEKTYQKINNSFSCFGTEVIGYCEETQESDKKGVIRLYIKDKELPVMHILYLFPPDAFSFMKREEIYIGLFVFDQTDEMWYLQDDITEFQDLFIDKWKYMVQFFENWLYREDKNRLKRLMTKEKILIPEILKTR